ncbi:MAG: hypothetical protein II295_07035, partial [Akkermansia sp.]|nr:hypothetical protein [Akkermansia sp.]
VLVNEPSFNKQKEALQTGDCESDDEHRKRIDFLLQNGLDLNAPIVDTKNLNINYQLEEGFRILHFYVSHFCCDAIEFLIDKGG